MCFLAEARGIQIEREINVVRIFVNVKSDVDLNFRKFNIIY
jgi:hypothetical protein